MQKRKFTLKDIRVRSDGIKVNISMGRIRQNLERAQYLLDGDVMNDMVPFMPHLNGTFIQVTRAASAAIQGSGHVYAAFSPQGRYLYKGKVMVNKKTGKGPAVIPGVGPRFPKGSKLKATKRPLQYTKDHHPKVTDQWFEAAKEAHGKRWIKKAKKTAGGG